MLFSNTHIEEWLIITIQFLKKMSVNQFDKINLNL